MKRSFYLLFSIAAVTIFSISPIALAGSHEKDKPKQAEEPKITKSDAQHTVLFAYPGSSIEKCELVKGKDHLNWAVTVVISGTTAATQVQVDGVTGKILTTPNTGNVRTGKM
jgi:hypothetical protein